MRDFIVSAILDGLWWFVEGFDDSNITPSREISTHRRRVAHRVAFNVYQFVGRHLI